LRQKKEVGFVPKSTKIERELTLTSVAFLFGSESVRITLWIHQNDFVKGWPKFAENERRLTLSSVAFFEAMRAGLRKPESYREVAAGFKLLLPSFKALFFAENSHLLSQKIRPPSCF
jgi:hypothetical protein